MKHTFLILLVAAIFSSPAADARGHRHSDCRHGRHACREHCETPRYMVIDNEVYYGGVPVKDASAMSFETLCDGYARDTWNVFYCGAKIKDASSGSFKVLGHGYAKDTWNVYYDGHKVDGASAGSFKTLRDGYARDTWNTYYRGRRIDNE